MSEQSYSNTLQLSADAQRVFQALTCEVDKWWSTRSNQAANTGEVLTVRFGDPYFMSMQVDKSVPNELLEWQVVGANMFVEGGATSNDEWVGTTIQWTIAAMESGTELTLLHQGLVASFECYDTCVNGWNYFLQSLKDYLQSGKGSPYDEAS